MYIKRKKTATVLERNFRGEIKKNYHCSTHILRNNTTTYYFAFRDLEISNPFTRKFCEITPLIK